MIFLMEMIFWLILLIFYESVLSESVYNQSVRVGERIVLNCTLNVSFRETEFSGIFQWLFRDFHDAGSNRLREFQLLCLKRDGQPDCIHVTPSDTNRVPSWLSRAHMTTRILETTPALPQHRGIYKCKFIEGKFLTHHIYLDVITPPEKPIISRSMKKIVESVPVELVCNSSGSNPLANLRWVWKDIKNNEIDDQNIINTTTLSSGIAYGWKVLKSRWLPRAMDDTRSVTCIAENTVAKVASNSMYLSVDYRPEIIDFPKSPYHVLKGSKLKLKCNSISKTATFYEWYNPQNKKVSDGSELIIWSVHRDNKGTYHCYVRNSVGISDAVVNVTVLEEPIIDLPDEVRVKFDTSLHLRCDTIPVQSHVSWWWPGNQPLSPSSSDRDLFIPIRKKRSFQIECRARVLVSVSVGSPDIYVNSQKTVNITVEYIPGKPQIRGADQPQSLTGSDVTLTCVPNKEEPGNPKPDYFWRKWNSKWAKNRTNYITFSNLEFQHSGIYGCTVYNMIGKSEEETYELLIEGQPVLVHPQGQISIIRVKPGSRIELGCQFEGRPQPALTWYYNNIVISSTTGAPVRIQYQLLSQMSVGSSLQAGPELISDRPDNNTFRCMGANRYGKSYHVFHLLMIYPLKLQSEVLVTAGNIQGLDYLGNDVYLNCTIHGSGNVTIDWIRKLSNLNEEAIVNGSKSYYFINYFFPNRLSTRSLLYFNKFTRHDFGRYLCRARNSEEHLETHFEVRRLSVPDPPIDLIAESYTWSSISISWIASFNGGYPQLFIVSLKMHGQVQMVQHKVVKTKVILRDLLPDTEYLISVSATNNLGTALTPLTTKRKTLRLDPRSVRLESVNSGSGNLWPQLSIYSNETGSLAYCLRVEAAAAALPLVQLEAQPSSSTSSLFHDSAWIPVALCDSDSGNHELTSKSHLARLCLVTESTFCSPLFALGPNSSDGIVTAEIIGTVAATCTCLVIILAILLFCILIRSKKLIPAVSNFKFIQKKNRNHEHLLKPSSQLSSLPKSASSTLYHGPTPNANTLLGVSNENGVYPLLNTYSCTSDQLTMVSNSMEILNICPPHDLFPEGLYSTLVKSNTITPFSLDVPPISTINRIQHNDAINCCCREDIPNMYEQNNQSNFDQNDDASNNNKVFYEVMV